jgi:hypothetical protein
VCVFQKDASSVFARAVNIGKPIIDKSLFINIIIELHCCEREKKNRQKL